MHVYMRRMGLERLIIIKIIIKMKEANHSKL